MQGAAALFVAESVEVAVGGQAVADGVEEMCIRDSVPAGLVQCGLFAGQLFAQGVQRPALAAGGGTVGRKISPAGLDVYKRQ